MSKSMRNVMCVILTSDVCFKLADKSRYMACSAPECRLFLPLQPECHQLGHMPAVLLGSERSVLHCLSLQSLGSLQRKNEDVSFKYIHACMHACIE